MNTVDQDIAILKADIAALKTRVTNAESWLKTHTWALWVIPVVFVALVAFLAQVL